MPCNYRKSDRISNQSRALSILCIHFSASFTGNIKRKTTPISVGKSVVFLYELYNSKIESFRSIPFIEWDPILRCTICIEWFYPIKWILRKRSYGKMKFDRERSERILVSLSHFSSEISMPYKLCNAHQTKHRREIVSKRFFFHFYYTHNTNTKSEWAITQQHIWCNSIQR